MTLDLVVKRGKLLLNGEVVEAALGINQGRIVKISKDVLMPKAEAYLDVDGDLVLPGMIDMHVHFRDPGYTYKEDFATGTMAAACGGVTTIADMPNNNPPAITPEAFKEKLETVKDKALIDYVLYAGSSLHTVHRLRELLRLGAIGVKLYMATNFEELLIPSNKIIKILKETAKHDTLCLIHAENFEALRKKLKDLKYTLTDPTTYAKVRDARLEWSGVRKALNAAHRTLAKIHLCHLSAEGSVVALRKAKEQGLKVTAETCPHYLLLTGKDLKKAGPLAKVDPPVKGGRHRKALWLAIQKGLIDVLASDHAPHGLEERLEGWKDLLKAPSGFASVEITLRLMLDSVNKGLLTLKQLVNLYSTNPAMILNLYPRKGVLKEGADADLVIVSMKREERIKAEKMHSKHPQTPFEGRLIKGIPRITILRGEVIAEEGEVKGKLGFGLMLRAMRRR